MAQKPSIPKGTRDFGPLEMAKRNYIFNTVRRVFELYGFKQIETPAMENLSTLMGKYGEEGDKLLFKILNSGDFLHGMTADEVAGASTARLAARFCEKGLRYDLTVPFARYVVQHREELQLPFKRFQIQPVWRADRPQKGRYREFYQCDVDVVGSDSLLNEVELMQITDTVFSDFGVRVQIKINNRKILTGIAEVIGEADKIVDITVAIDTTLFRSQKLDVIAGVLKDSEIGMKGVEEMRFILSALGALDGNGGSLNNELQLDLTLARGLNYYTGAIFEVKAKDVRIGSITGGGRYDNLTGIFGMPGLSGVGISFGADRIYDVLNQLDLYPKEAVNGTQVLFINFGEKEIAYCMPIAQLMRKNGVSTEVYADSVKMKKQMNYANATGVSFVALVGENEMNDGKVTLKNMQTGEQQMVTPEEMLAIVKQ